MMILPLSFSGKIFLTPGNNSTGGTLTWSITNIGGTGTGSTGITQESPPALNYYSISGVGAALSAGANYIFLHDMAGVVLGTAEVNCVDDETLPYACSGSALRGQLGMAAANLDTQLAAITPGLDAAGVRAAIGMAAANLDTQLAAIGPGLTAAGVRAAIGMAAANLDTQLAAIGPGLTAAGVRTAIGLATANLDTQLAGQPALLLDLASGVETSITVRQALRAIGAVLCGQATVGGGHTIFQAIGNPATVRVDGTTPGSGDRTAVALTL
jgi:hypothetical protein